MDLTVGKAGQPTDLPAKSPGESTIPQNGKPTKVDETVTPDGTIATVAAGTTTAVVNTENASVQLSSNAAADGGQTDPQATASDDPKGQE